MASTLRIGNVEILALIDCEAKAAPTALFPSIGQEQWKQFCEHLIDDCTNLKLTIPTFIVRSQGKTVLIDSGVGAKDRGWLPNGRLPEVLREEGIDPASIDVVMATHIHIDHVGWHTTRAGDDWVPTFPKATHVFVKDEYDFFTASEQAENPAMPWVKDCVLPLDGKVEMQLVHGEYRITDELTLLPTPGHTPAHSSVAIMSGGEAGVVIGDVCHHPAQVTESAWEPVFDLNPALAAKTREALMDRIEREKSIAIAGHFAHPGFGRVVRVNGRRSWQAL